MDCLNFETNHLMVVRTSSKALAIEFYPNCISRTSKNYSMMISIWSLLRVLGLHLGLHKNKIKIREKKNIMDIKSLKRKNQDENKKAQTQIPNNLRLAEVLNATVVFYFVGRKKSLMAMKLAMPCDALKQLLGFWSTRLILLLK